MNQPSGNALRGHDMTNRTEHNAYVATILTALKAVKMKGTSVQNVGTYTDENSTVSHVTQVHLSRNRAKGLMIQVTGSVPTLYQGSRMDPVTAPMMIGGFRIERAIELQRDLNRPARDFWNS